MKATQSEAQALADLKRHCRNWANVVPEQTFIAFAGAIAAGRLSMDPNADNFISRVLYLGTIDG